MKTNCFAHIQDNISTFLRFLGLCLIFGATTQPAPAADSFVGTWDVDWYSDLNIQDGVTIDHQQVTLTGSRPDAQHVTFDDGVHDITLFQDNDILRVESPPIDTGTALIPAAYVMSDGTNSVWGGIRQAYGDPTAIGFGVGISTRSSVPVSAADLAGYWKFDAISHPNILNISNTPPEPFTRDSDSYLWQITDLGDNKLQIDDLVRGTFGVAELNDNRLNMLSLNPWADYHVVEMATDGSTLSFITVASETYDMKDVSLTIGLAQKVETIPAPGAAILGVLGTALVGWLRRYKKLGALRT